MEGEGYVSPGEVREQVQGQLKALKTDYLDLCLLPALSDGAAFQVHCLLRLSRNISQPFPLVAGPIVTGVRSLQMSKL